MIGVLVYFSSSTSNRGCLADYFFTVFECPKSFYFYPLFLSVCLLLPSFIFFVFCLDISPFLDSLPLPLVTGSFFSLSPFLPFNLFFFCLLRGFGLSLFLSLMLLFGDLGVGSGFFLLCLDDLELDYPVLGLVDLDDLERVGLSSFWLGGGVLLALERLAALASSDPAAANELSPVV